MRIINALALSTAFFLAACGGGGGDTPTAGPSIETVAGVYTNDANTNASMIIDTDGSYWSFAVDRLINPSAFSTSVGNMTVANTGAFTASGTAYRGDYNGLFYSNLNATGTVDNDRLWVNTTVFGSNTSGSLTRVKNDVMTGNIPGRQWALNWVLLYPLSKSVPANAATLSISSVSQHPADKVGPLAVSPASTWTGTISGCPFTGLSNDSGRGYARITIQFGNSQLCRYPAESAHGIIGYNPTTRTIAFILRMDPSPYRVLFGTGA